MADASDKSELVFSESGFLFDPVTGLTYTLNATGSFIYRRLRNGEGIESILDALTQEFDVDKETAEVDLRDFMQQLRDFGLT